MRALCACLSTMDRKRKIRFTHGGQCGWIVGAAANGDMLKPLEIPEMKTKLVPGLAAMSKALRMSQRT